MGRVFQAIHGQIFGQNMEKGELLYQDEGKTSTKEKTDAGRGVTSTSTGAMGKHIINRYTHRATGAVHRAGGGGKREVRSGCPAGRARRAAKNRGAAGRADQNAAGAGAACGEKRESLTLL